MLVIESPSTARFFFAQIAPICGRPPADSCRSASARLRLKVLMALPPGGLPCLRSRMQRKVAAVKARGMWVPPPSVRCIASGLLQQPNPQDRIARNDPLRCCLRAFVRRVEVSVGLRQRLHLTLCGGCMSVLETGQALSCLPSGDLLTEGAVQLTRKPGKSDPAVSAQNLWPISFSAHLQSVSHYLSGSGLSRMLRRCRRPPREWGPWWHSGSTGAAFVRLRRPVPPRCTAQQICAAGVGES